jgi:hypothetical protein
VVSSFVVAVSSFAVGGSFMGLIVMFTVAIFEFSKVSFAIYVKLSMP